MDFFSNGMDCKNIEGNRQLKMASNQACNLLTMVAKNMPKYSKELPLQDRPAEISVKLFHLFLQNFCTNRNTSFYAEKLFITQDYLYKILQKTIGMSQRR